MSSCTWEGDQLESNGAFIAQEYEKRLLAKDHDLKCSQAQLEHVRVELAEVKRIQAEGSHLLPAPEAHEGACPAVLQQVSSELRHDACIGCYAKKTDQLCRLQCSSS